MDSINSVSNIGGVEVRIQVAFSVETFNAFEDDEIFI